MSKPRRRADLVTDDSCIGRWFGWDVVEQILIIDFHFSIPAFSHCHISGPSCILHWWAEMSYLFPILGYLNLYRLRNSNFSSKLIDDPVWLSMAVRGTENSLLCYNNYIIYIVSGDTFCYSSFIVYSLLLSRTISY